MRDLFLVFIYSCCFIYASAQNDFHQSRIDEINSLIANETSRKVKVKLLLEQSQLYYYQVNYKEQEQSLEAALDIVLQTKNPQQTIEVYLAISYLGLRDIPKEDHWEEYPDKALLIAREIRDSSLVIQALEAKAIWIELEDKKKALAEHQKILQLRKDNNASDYELALSYYYIGKSSTRLSLINSSLGYLEKAISLLKPIVDDPQAYDLLGDVYIEISYYYSYLNMEDPTNRTVETLDSALIIFHAIKNLAKENKARTNLSEALAQSGEYDKALDHLQLVIKNSKEYVRGGDLSAMGLLSYYNKNYEESLEYYTKGYEKAVESKNMHEAAITECCIAFVHSQLKEFDKGMPYLNKAHSYAQEHKDTTILLMVYQARSKMYLDMGMKKKSISDRKKIIKIESKKNKLKNTNYQKIQISKIYLKLNQLDSALAYNTQADKYYKDKDLTTLKSDIANTFHKIYKQKNDYKMALQYLEKHNMYQNNIESKNLKKRLSNERVNMKVVEAEEAVNEAEEETAIAIMEASFLERQKQLYSIIAIILLGVLIIGIYFYMQLQKIKNKLTSQNLQLQQLNATKDKFFGIIAHDIRSPIVALDGVGNLMEHYVEKDKKDKLKRLAGRVDSTAKQLGGLLDNLLKWALLQQGVIPYHPKALSVNELAQNTLDMFQHNADAKGVKLESSIDPNLQVNADESALNTILRNLISNAIKFTPSDGTVSINTETKDGKVFININDTGTGISAEKLKTLFSLEKKSEKGTAGEKGTGLGLTLVKELAELNNGFLDVSSKLNEGSQFSIGLPMAA